MKPQFLDLSMFLYSGFLSSNDRLTFSKMWPTGSDAFYAFRWPSINANRMRSEVIQAASSSSLY